jgi:hypothetical protein
MPVIGANQKPLKNKWQSVRRILLYETEILKAGEKIWFYSDHVPQQRKCHNNL